MKILFKSLLLTVVTLILTYLTSKLSETRIFKIVFPETTALEEFEITDVAFKNRKDPAQNEEIILVNLGGQTRRDVARQIDIISKCKPRIIGIDYIFDCPDGMRDTINCPDMRDTLGYRMLEESIAGARNVVLSSRLLKDESQGNMYDSARHSDPEFTTGALREGYTNLETEDAVQDNAKTCRQFIPKISINGKMNYSFAVEVARLYDSTKANEFLQRKNFYEIINYRGNVIELQRTSNYPETFYLLEANDVMTGNFIPEMLKDRIVIMGYAGDGTQKRSSWVDKYYTPLNKTIAGKTTPDMYGVVIQANIVSMILDRDYVDTLSDLNEFVLAFFVCLLHIYILLIIKEKMPRLFEVLALSLIFIQLISYSYLRIFSMQYFSFKLNLIVTLGSLAIASLSINIFSGIFESIINKRISVLKEKSHPVEKAIP